MNKVRLSNYSDKETDIDCSHNEITTLILEGFYTFLFGNADYPCCGHFMESDYTSKGKL